METANTKQVRVDNWGIFFLQRLQMFFSKTDYCDLTLQFEGNVQLKVHRLVINACTEYFAFLEQTCPAMEENTILMPSDMQADIIVPIVNFMYTGMLEFHYAVFERIYKAAEMMNIQILMKLLEAQLPLKPPMAVGAKKKNDLLSSSFGQGTSTKKHQTQKSPLEMMSKKPISWSKRRPTVHPVSATFNDKWSVPDTPKDPLSLPDNTPKPTRFEWPDDDLPSINLMDISFDEISYTSKPLLTREEEQRAGTSFDDVKSSIIEKAPSTNDNSTNLNMQEVEEYVKEQKIRTDLNDFYHEDGSSTSTQIKKRKQDSNLRSTAANSPKRAKLSDKESKETTVSVKSTTTELDHTKIVSEILKKYPGLVKKNKNIKLKIMASPGKALTPEQMKAQASMSTTIKKTKVQVTSPIKKEIKTEPVSKPEKTEIKKFSEDGPWVCTKCNDGESPEFVLYYLYRKHMGDVHSEVFDKRYCKYCGKYCSTEELMGYHLYTKHGLKPPSSLVFPKCPQCPFIAITEQRMLQHKERHRPDQVQCMNCKLCFESKTNLTAHIQITGHLNKNRSSAFDCGYCMKKLQASVILMTHIKTQHLKEGIRDGIVGLEENMEVEDVEAPNQEEEEENRHPEEAQEEEDSEYILPINIEHIPKKKKTRQNQKEKVKIISNVKVPQQEEQTSAEPARTLDPSSEAEALNNVASGIATSLGLVDIVVLDENQQYILQQQQNQSENEFILPELTSNGGMLQTSQDINSTDELVMVLADQDYPDSQNQENSDNSNIVVLYSHPVDGQQGQFITSQGNLLVNSQTGMLEIRNGAAIATTTASQVMTVNTSHDSPAESIEMIQREIESHTSQEVHSQAPEKVVIQQEISETVTTQEETVSKEILTQEQIPVSSEEDLNKSVDSSVVTMSSDVTDGAIEQEEEPMEVEESETIEKPQETTELTEEKQLGVLETVDPEPTPQDSTDVPPTETYTTDRTIPLYTEGGNAVILNEIDQSGDLIASDLDTSDVTQNAEEVTQDTETEHNVTLQSTESIENNLEEVQQTEYVSEPMEVDGVVNKETVGKEPADAVPVVQQEEPQTINEVVTESVQVESQNQSEQSQEVAIEDIPLPPESNSNSEENLQHNTDSNPNLESEQQNEGGDEEESQSSQEPAEQEEEDDESRTTADINRAILEDWEDTDSQQSQSEKQKSVINKEAVENVNKLMDDWDEEDEDDKRKE